MKKLKRISLFSASIVSLLSVTSTILTSCNKTDEKITEDKTLAKVAYSLRSDDTYEVTGLTNASDQIKKIVIPSSYQGKAVSVIAKGALKNCANVESVTLPFIGKSKTATGIEGMFGYVFGDEMYEGCGGFTWQEIGFEDISSVVYGKYAIPNTLSSVEITSATKIPAGAFSNCKHLESIKINGPEITKIESKAFYFCSSLSSFDFSKLPALTTIERAAFERCYTIQKVDIPSTVTTIGKSAFANCISASTMTIPSSVATCESNSFYNIIGGVILVEDSINDTLLKKWAADWCEATATVIYDFKSSNPYKYVEDWLVVVCGKEGAQYGYLAQWMGNWQQTSITIPGSIEVDGKSLPIKILGSKLFYENTYIKSITFNEGVSHIYASAFQGCSALEYVNFPASLQTIRAQAFAGCTNLVGHIVDGKRIKNIDFSNTDLWYIDQKAFYGCSSIPDLKLGKVQHIGDYAFAYCSHLCPDTTEDPDNCLLIPSTVKELGKGAFKYCFKHVPEGVTASTYYPTVKFGDNNDIKFIPESCFESCGVRVLKPTTGEDAGTTYPKYIRVHMNLNNAHLIRIEDAAFKNCWIANLTGARETHLKYIGDYAFYYAQPTSDLESAIGKQDLQMDQEIEYIGQYAFAYCTTVQSLTFNTAEDIDGSTQKIERHHSNLKHLGQYAFYGCNNLNFTTVDMSPCLLLETDFETTKADVTQSARYAFAQCTNLTTFKLPGTDIYASEPKGYYYELEHQTKVYDAKSFKELPERFFEGDTNLGKDENWYPMYIPKYVTAIRPAVFNGCSYLKNVYFDGTLNYYGSSIFYNCISLEHITQTDKTTAIKFDADAITRDRIGSSIYYNCKKLQDFPLPVGPYQKGVTYKDYYTIPSNMFQNNEAMTSFEIPVNISSIGTSAFQGCTGLTTVTHPNHGSVNLTSIGANAFYGCTKLATLTSNTWNNISSIGASAFYGCTSLAKGTGVDKFYLPTRSLTMGSKPFEGWVDGQNVYLKKANCYNYGTSSGKVNPLADATTSFQLNGTTSWVFTRHGATSADWYWTCAQCGSSNVKFYFEAI